VGGVNWEDVPFRPGWGDEPPEFAGRAVLVHEVLLGLSRGPSGGELHHIFTGGRGTGKTVLLAHLERYVATEWQWPVIRWAGGAGDLRELLNEVGARVERELTSKVGRALRPDSIAAKLPAVGTITKVVTRTSGDKSPRAWLEHLGQLAADKNRGVLFAVDEIQDVPTADLATLAQSLQIVAKRARLPVALIAAGLPHTRRLLRSIPGSPFLERQPQHEIGNLDQGATRDALELPILDAGRTITDDALARLVDASGGYPYAIQVIGAQAWLADITTDTITLDHAHHAEQRMLQILEEQLYTSRWDDLSDLQQRYVLTAAGLSTRDGASTPAIAAALGRSTSDLSTVRDDLITRHHLLYPVRTGYVAFTIPGFDRWVLQRTSATRSDNPSRDHPPDPRQI
jgi:hypothetical protein